MGSFSHMVALWRSHVRLQLALQQVVRAEIVNECADDSLRSRLDVLLREIVPGTSKLLQLDHGGALALFAVTVNESLVVFLLVCETVVGCSYVHAFFED